MSLSNPLTLGKKKDYLKVRRSIGAMIEDIGSTVTIRQFTSTTVNPPLLQKRNPQKKNQLPVVLNTNQRTMILPKLRSCLKNPKPLSLPPSNRFHKPENHPQQPPKQVQFLEVPNPQQNNLVTFLLHPYPKGKPQSFHKPQFPSQVLLSHPQLVPHQCHPQNHHKDPRHLNPLPPLYHHWHPDPLAQHL
jgi:hypothetical protein